MMAFFGSVSKAPIATILMVVEMTGSETLLVPAMVAIFIGYYVAGRYHLYDEQVQNRLSSPAHTTEYFAEFLRHMPITAALETGVVTVPTGGSVEEASFALSSSPFPVVAVVDGAKLAGELRLADILDVPVAERRQTTVTKILRDTFPRVGTDVTMLDAVGVMDREGIDALLVTKADAADALAGVVTRSAIARFQKTPKLAAWPALPQS
jgi:chloride channel protein, CIC family